MIAVDEAGRVTFVSQQCSKSVAFAADMIAVFAAQQIEFNDTEVRYEAAVHVARGNPAE